jgi:hypothetical protein
MSTSDDGCQGKKDKDEGVMMHSLLTWFFFLAATEFACSVCNGLARCTWVVTDRPNGYERTLPSEHKLRKSKTNTSASHQMPPAINRIQNGNLGSGSRATMVQVTSGAPPRRRPEMRYTLTQNLDKTLDRYRNNDYNEDESKGQHSGRRGWCCLKKTKRKGYVQ